VVSDVYAPNRGKDLLNRFAFAYSMCRALRILIRGRRVGLAGGRAAAGVVCAAELGCWRPGAKV
jgi:hypothetical protein